MFAFLTVGIFNSFKVNSEKPFPPVANTGDPVSGNVCARSGCHNGPVLTPDSTTLTLNIGTGTPTTTLDNSFIYTPSTVYNISFVINAFTGNYGFQMDALNTGNKQAGRFNVTNAATTSLKFVKIGTDTVYYIGHKNASTTKSWTYKWTSPAAGSGPVTFYYAYNAGDNNDDAIGDMIYQSAVTINELPNGIAAIDTKISNLNIFPNPVTKDFGISFDMKESDKVTAYVYSLDGKLSKELMNERVLAGSFTRGFDMNGFAAGVYLVQLNIGNAQVVKKIVKQ
ncbi:MAG: choice-of-anchor V domain-containing protein [Chitinophagales bacterium]